MPRDPLPLGRLVGRLTPRRAAFDAGEDRDEVEAEGEFPGRPELPDALLDESEADEDELRMLFVGQIDTTISHVQELLRKHPKRALRWLSLLNGYLMRQTQMVAELSLEDGETLDRGDEEGLYVGGDFAGGMAVNAGLGRGRRRNRQRAMARAMARRGGDDGVGGRYAGGHHYRGDDGQNAPERLLDMAYETADLQRLNQLLDLEARTRPDGSAPDPVLYDYATRELAALRPPLAIPPVDANEDALVAPDPVAQLRAGICPSCGGTPTRRVDPRQVGDKGGHPGMWVNYRCTCGLVRDVVEEVPPSATFQAERETALNEIVSPDRSE